MSLCCENCGKNFSHRSNKYRHQTKCKVPLIDTVIQITETSSSLNSPYQPSSSNEKNANSRDLHLTSLTNTLVKESPKLVDNISIKECRICNGNHDTHNCISKAKDTKVTIDVIKTIESGNITCQFEPYMPKDRPFIKIKKPTTILQPPETQILKPNPSLLQIECIHNIDIYQRCIKILNGKQPAIDFLCKAILSQDINSVYKRLFLIQPNTSPVIFVYGKFRYINPKGELIDDGSDNIVKVIYDNIHKAMINAYGDKIKSYVNQNSTEELFEHHNLLDYQNGILLLCYSEISRIKKYKTEFENLISIENHPLNESGRKFISI